MKTILINFKTYPEGTGSRGLKLARNLRKAFPVIIACQSADIRLIKKSGAKVYSQHIDPLDEGRNTGFVIASTIKKAGADGTMINHSEHRIKGVSDCIKKAKNNGLKTVVCAETPREISRFASQRPDFLALELPELIGTMRSITKVKPNAVRVAVKKSGNVPLLCGSGISNYEDAKAASELGCDGVLISTTILKARNPRKKLKEISEAF